MKILVLGSGQASGVPAWNDGSELALRARVRDPAVPRRAGAALAVSADGLRYTLLEAPFGLPDALTRHPLLAPAPGRRAAPVDAIVLSSAELDAVGGALALRHGLAARIVSPVLVRDTLADRDEAFRTLAPLWTGLAWDRAWLLDREERLEARLFPLPGPPPDHLGEAGAAAGRARCGVRITDRRSGARIVWAPRIAQLDSATLAELRAADLRFVDGTCYADEEARRLRPGARCVRDLGHTPIDGQQGSLVQLAGMGGRSFYVHLAATNPLCDRESKETHRVRAAGVEIAEDGMEVET